LDSFAAQTRLPDELIVCDDGSEDKTISIIEDFSQRAPFTVRLIKNPKNLGFIKNFEKALSLCTGDLILFSDQDDVWFPEKVQYIKIVFEKEKNKFLVIHDGKLVDERLQWYGATKLGQVRAGWSDDQYFITGALTAMHKNLKQYVLPFPDDITVGHDVWIHLIAKFLGIRMVIDKPLQLIRRHTSNTSTWVASSITKISKLTVFQSHFNAVAASSYQDRIYLNESLLKRLEYIKSEESNKFPACLIDDSLKYLRAERLALYDRQELLKAGFFARRVGALQMLACGKYKYFNGLMSFLRDLYRN
jgi:glycosyltransferase involved in cell wall biosynthesis